MKDAFVSFALFVVSLLVSPVRGVVAGGLERMRLSRKVMMGFDCPWPAPGFRPAPSPRIPGFAIQVAL